MKLNQSSDRSGQPEVVGDGIVSQLNLTGREPAPFGGSSLPAAPQAKERRLLRRRAAAVQTLILAAIAAVVLSFLALIAAGLRNHGIGFSLG